MYEAVEAFISGQAGRGILLGMVLVVPLMMWAIPEARKDLGFGMKPRRKAGGQAPFYGGELA